MTSCNYYILESEQTKNKTILIKILKAKHFFYLQDFLSNDLYIYMKKTHYNLKFKLAKNIVEGCDVIFLWKCNTESFSSVIADEQYSIRSIASPISVVKQNSILLLVEDWSVILSLKHNFIDLFIGYSGWKIFYWMINFIRAAVCRFKIIYYTGTATFLRVKILFI